MSQRVNDRALALQQLGLLLWLGFDPWLMPWAWPEKSIRQNKRKRIKSKKTPNQHPSSQSRVLLDQFALALPWAAGVGPLTKVWSPRGAEGAGGLMLTPRGHNNPHQASTGSLSPCLLRCLGRTTMPERRGLACELSPPSEWP